MKKAIESIKLPIINLNIEKFKIIIIALFFNTDSNVH